MDSDARLVELTLRGETDAFARLVRRYERLARAAAIRIVNDSHLTEDVLQESFIAAYKSLPNLATASKFGPWLQGIVRRQAVRALRRRREAVVVPDAHDTLLAEQHITLPKDSLALLEIVDRLPDADRTLIGLRHFQGHSMVEIAAITERPVGTVTKQLSRIHKKLKQWLSEETFDD